MIQRTDHPPLHLSWMIWGLGAMLYLIGFYQRVAPGVMTAELMVDFSLSAAALGNLSAFYFYSYVAMQVPTGLLADHWGPRRLLTLGAMIAAVGTSVFALASDVWWAGLGRLLIGGSVAVAFVGMLKLAGHWLPQKLYALASGMALFFGILGAVFAGVPLRLLVDGIGWRSVMLGSALLTAAVALAIWWLVRDDPSEKNYQSYALDSEHQSERKGGTLLNGIGEVFRYLNTWLLSLIPGGVVGTVLTFAGLWGVPYLTSHYGLQKTDAAAICSLLLIAWAIGGPVFGWLSDHLGHRKPLYALGCVMQLASWSLVLLVPALPVWLLISLLIVAGFFAGNMIIGFAYARESVPSYLSGTISGVVNMGVMMGPMVLQPAVGWVLDLLWSGQLVDGVRHYGIEAYRSGFLLMLGWLALSTLLIFFTRETHCRQYR